MMKTKPKSFISHLDVNNLHGYAMSQNLPTGNFYWLNKVEIEGKFSEILGQQYS